MLSLRATSSRLFPNGSLPSTPMVIGVLASGNAFVGHLTNKANLHKKAALKTYSCATCPLTGRSPKLRQQINIVRRIRGTRLAGRADETRLSFEEANSEGASSSGLEARLRNAM